MAQKNDNTRELRLFFKTLRAGSFMACVWFLNSAGRRATISVPKALGEGPSDGFTYG